MRYVALLRGINVGGNNKVPMADLREIVSGVGGEEVRTYINSGNVIFDHTSRSASKIATMIEEGITTELGLQIRVLVMPAKELQRIAGEIPDTWTNDGEVRTDVLFLWNEVDSPGLLDELDIRDGVDEVVHVPGALLWRIDRENRNLSWLNKLVASAPYRSMTIRNANTVRKLAELSG